MQFNTTDGIDLLISVFKMYKKIPIAQENPHLEYFQEIHVLKQQ